MSMKIDKATVAWLASQVVAALWLTSAFGHLDNSYRFLMDIYNYRLLGLNLGLALAFLLPSMQLVLGIALLFLPSYRLPALGLSAGLFLMFISAQLIAWQRGLDISCGCFGSAVNHKIGWRSIMPASVGLVFTLLAGHCSMSTNREFKVLEESSHAKP
jgi:putative oxidoreductase